MIDLGILSGVVAAYLAAVVVARLTVATTSLKGAADTMLGPGMAGLAVGRIAFLALDDPASLLSPRDVILVGGGVEFWPAVAAAVAMFLFQGRNEATHAVSRLAEIAPAALVGYGMYEGGCLTRGGCFGPSAPIGLRPPAVATSMVPIGLLVAVTAVALALVVHRMARSAPSVAVLVAVGGAAASRAVAGYFLPAVGTGLSRPHATSLVMTGFAVAGSVALLWKHRPGAEPSRVEAR